MPAWRRLLGALFQNLVISKFHISTTSSVSVHSRLWSPVKLWAVTLSEGIPLSRSSIARILSLCFGDSPESFNVCIFGPPELLIRGKFLAENVSFITIPSFRKAFSTTPQSDSVRQTEEKIGDQASTLLRNSSPSRSTCQANLLIDKANSAQPSQSSKSQALNPHKDMTPISVESQKEPSSLSESLSRTRSCDVLEGFPCSSEPLDRIISSATSSRDQSFSPSNLSNRRHCWRFKSAGRKTLQVCYLAGLPRLIL
jgi:hypothetical protein